MRRLAAGCLALLCLAASASAGGARLPTLKAKCRETYGVAAKPLQLTASDGIELYAIEAGSGRTAVVLAHESPGDLCGWLPYIPSLTRAGLRVLALDLRGFGDSEAAPGGAYHAFGRDLAAAVARARADGAKRVILMGASYGGAVVLTYAPQLPVAGVISLSGEVYLPDARHNPLASASRLRVPLLVVGSRHDHYLPVEDARALVRRAATKDKRAALYPGYGHGWEIVEGPPYAAQARALILSWIRARS